MKRLQEAVLNATRILEDKEDTIARITILDNEKWFIKYMDSTHFVTSFDGEKWGIPWHVGQVGDYKAKQAITNWLHNPVVGKQLGTFPHL